MYIRNATNTIQLSLIKKIEQKALSLSHLSLHAYTTPTTLDGIGQAIKLDFTELLSYYGLS